MVKSDDTELVSKFKVKSFPSFYLLKGNDKPVKYEGESYTYKELFEFINIYSETFVFVGDQEQKEVKSAASKPWLNVAAPFMTKDSGNDICLQKDGTLCVIYVVSDKGASDQNVVNSFGEVKDAFASKIERGISFNFMRLDAASEPAFADMFTGGDGSALPMVVVMNPGKRKRFLKHENSMDAAGLT